MTDPISSYKLSELGVIDYKKPLGNQQDLRTSTYLGHKFVDETMLGNKIHKKYKETIPYEEDSLLETRRIPHYKADYRWKDGNPDEIRNIYMSKQILHMKPYYDCNLKFIKRKMKPLTSVSHSDYRGQQESKVLAQVVPHMPSAVPTTTVCLDRSKPAYSKYLDTSGTTSRVDYCHRSSKDILNGIAANDYITFWNWENMDIPEKRVVRKKNEYICDTLPSKHCPGKYPEYPCTVKRVPNSGLTTEVRENYKQPYERAIPFDNVREKNDLPFVAVEPSVGKTEYGVLCSGERTQKYI